MDRRPRARAADADAVRSAQILGELGGGLDEFRKIVRRLDSGLVVHLAVIRGRVELEAPRYAPLLGVGRSERARQARRSMRWTPASPGCTSSQSYFGLVLVGIFDPRVEVFDPARRPVGPGHVGAGHEGVVLARLRRESGRHLVEVHVLREDVVGDVHARQTFEVVEVRDHRVGVRMLVQEKVKLRAVEFFPVEIGRERLSRGGVEQEIGGRGADAELRRAAHQFAPAHLAGLECRKELFRLVVHRFLLGFLPSSRSAMMARPRDFSRYSRR